MYVTTIDINITHYDYFVVVFEMVKHVTSNSVEGFWLDFFPTALSISRKTNKISGHKTVMVMDVDTFIAPRFHKLVKKYPD